MTAPPTDAAAPRRTGRPPKTSRPQLVAAARELATEHGFQSVTVGKVTDRCEVKHSTFWRHFPSSAALTAAVVDAILAEATVPALADWRDQATATADVLRAVLAKYPGMSAAVARLTDRPRWLADARFAVAERMARAGIGDHDAAAGVNGLFWLALAEPGQVGWREITILCDGIAARAWDAGERT